MMRKSYLKYLVALLLFGSNGIVASRITLVSYDIVFLRTLIGSLLLIAILLFTGGRAHLRHRGRSLPFLIVSGAAMGASWMFLYEAYQRIGVGIASLAYYCGPVIVMALSPLLFDERLTWPRLLGFAAVLCGVFLIDGQTLQAGGDPWGLLCGALSAVMYAVMVVFNKKATAIEGLENATIQLTVSFLTVAVFVGIRQGFAIPVETTDWPWILALGLVNTGIGCYLYFSSIGGLPVQTVAICGYLEPLSAVVLSVIVLGEGMQPVQVLGAVLILGGAIFGEAMGMRLDRVKREREGA